MLQRWQTAAPALGSRDPPPAPPRMLRLSVHTSVLGAWRAGNSEGGLNLTHKEFTGFVVRVYRLLFQNKVEFEVF